LSTLNSKYLPLGLKLNPMIFLSLLARVRELENGGDSFCAEKMEWVFLTSDGTIISRHYAQDFC
jgi:hypothetical protein